MGALTTAIARLAGRVSSRDASLCVAGAALLVVTLCGLSLACENAYHNFLVARHCAPDAIVKTVSGHFQGHPTFRLSCRTM